MATTQTNSERTRSSLSQLELVPTLDRSLDRSSVRLLAPHRLGFESNPRQGSARGPSPVGSSPTRPLHNRRLTRVTTIAGGLAPPQHRSVETGGLTSPARAPRSPHQAREQQRTRRQCRPTRGTTITGSHHHPGTEVPKQLGGRRARAPRSPQPAPPSPRARGRSRRENATSATCTTDVATGGDPITVTRRSHLRGSTWQ
jgi:hypothetical protein